MNKTFKKVAVEALILCLSIAALISTYLLAFDSGYNQGTRDTESQYEKGLEDAASAISSMYQFYPDELNSSDGNVVTKVIVNDDLRIVRILWLKNRDGVLDYGLATTYEKLPTK